MKTEPCPRCGKPPEQKQTPTPLGMRSGVKLLNVSCCGISASGYDHAQVVENWNLSRGRPAVVAAVGAALLLATGCAATVAPAPEAGAAVVLPSPHPVGPCVDMP